MTAGDEAGGGPGAADRGRREPGAGEGAAAGDEPSATPPGLRWPSVTLLTLLFLGLALAFGALNLAARGRAGAAGLAAAGGAGLAATAWVLLGRRAGGR